MNEYGLNGVALTRINQPIKPSLDDFLHANILVTSYEDWLNQPQISWYYRAHLKKELDAIEIVGNIEITQYFATIGSYS